MGSIFSVVEASYPGQEAKANDLMTYPTLFMGIGNLIAMPWAFTIGRRPVFLASILLLLAGGVWCQCSTSLESHIAGRIIMSLAAGQSEALAPLIIQEIHFVHERSAVEEQYEPRCWRNDIQLFVSNPKFSDIPTFYKHVFQGLFIPTTVWLLLLNGANLGTYVFEASTFASILMAPPYNFSFDALGYVQAGQIVCCLVFLPLLGYGSDMVIRVFSCRNNGIYKPEYRLPVIAIPAIVGIICGIIYGRAGARPESWSVASIVIGYNASYFAFLGANIVGITYAVDSFPFRAAPFLVVICAGRGFISFGLSYATLPAVATLGYDGTMIVEEVICAVLALFAIPMYFLGPRIREYVQSWCELEKFS